MKHITDQADQPKPATASSNDYNTALSIRACVVTSQRPARLTKERRLDANGNIITEQGGHLSIGEANNVTFNSMTAFGQFLDNAKHNQALIAATHVGNTNPITVMSKGAYQAAGEPPNTLTRTKDNFVQQLNTGGLLILDCDDKHISKADFIAAIKKVIPLDGIATAYTTSSSSHLYNGAEQLTGDTGKRLYIAVKDASDIERAGAALFDRLWLESERCGYYEISKSGAMLERAIIDKAMFQTNRLDFVAGSLCIAPLEQRRPAAEVTEGKPLDSLLAIPDLSKGEAEKLAAVKASRRALLEGEAKQIENKYISSKALENCIKNGNTNPTTEQLDAAKINVKKALDNAILTGDFVLMTADNKAVTVAEVLSDKERWDGVELKDPIENDYNNYKNCAKLLLLNGRPIINSFAHGGRKYHLLKQSKYIQHVAGTTTETTNTTLDLMRLSPDFYDMGDQLVMVSGGRVTPMTRELLRYTLGGIAQYYTEKTDKEGKTITTLIDVPKEVAEHILALKQHRRLKPLNAVINSPTITLDNHIVYKRGYDSHTGLYLSTGDDIQPPASEVTPAAVMAAYNEIMAVLDTFKLDTKLDRSVALSAFLAAIVRPTLSKSIGYIADAPTKGSGKSYLINCLNILATGEPAAMTPAIQNNEAEIQKTILSMLMNGARSIVWDNVMGAFNSATIAALLTSEVYSGRVLGASTLIELPNKASFYITSNNASLHSDLTRRFLTIRLDTGEENAINAERDLSAINNIMPDLYIKRNRQRLVMAGITIIRGYLNSHDHKQHGKVTKALVPSFEGWDVLCRQPVCQLAMADPSLGLTDPKQSLDKNLANDPEKETLTSLLHLLDLWRGSLPFTAKELLQTRLTNPIGFIERSDELAQLFLDITKRNDLTARSVGSVLSYRKGRIADGLKLELVKEDAKRGHQYRVIHIQ